MSLLLVFALVVAVFASIGRASPTHERTAGSGVVSGSNSGFRAGAARLARDFWRGLVLCSDGRPLQRCLNEMTERRSAAGSRRPPQASKIAEPVR